MLKKSNNNKTNDTDIFRGTPLPLGATIKNNAVQFSIFSRNATTVRLLLFNKPNDAKPCREIELDKDHNKTGDIWHIEVKNIKAGQLYLYQIDGEYNPEEGHRFNPSVYILDPYAKAVTPDYKWDLRKAGALNKRGDDIESAETMPKCVVVNDEFNWENDRHPKIPLRDTIIYEMHAKGFTKHQSSNVSSKGTYSGIIEKIPYLKELGITAIELLPIHQFDNQTHYRSNPKTNEKLTDNWGYNTMLFFSPHYEYCSDQGSKSDLFPYDMAVKEFKTMVKELHKNGIEVILDVVFNHTAEGNEFGMTTSFKGIDNSIYYILEDDKSKYKNYSGCGNTVNCNHPVVLDLITESLHYWVNIMHVDGFRFDLASILGRDGDGNLMNNAPLLDTIAQDPLLRDIKIIAEAWDAGGAYQVGGFQDRWGEWNGKYRDDIRRYWKGDEGMTSLLATRFGGSSDIYHSDKTPLHSINFLTSHDGFTLSDLVSYNEKHNEANGENNRDGSNNDYSYNYGKEGETDNKDINRLRKQQIKNMLATLFLSQGVPMLLSGDEIRRTQQGNNNAYCQDNEISWFDWTFIEKHKDIFEFTKNLINFRKKHPAFRREHFFTGKEINDDVIPDISWHNEYGQKHNWDGRSRTLGAMISGDKYSIHQGISEDEKLKTNLLYDDLSVQSGDNDAFIIFHSGYQPVNFIMPEMSKMKKWHLFIDTSKDNEEIAKSFKDAKEVSGSYEVKGLSMVVLLSDTGE